MTPSQPLSRPEFVALMAMIAAATAFAIDAMLPALPQIAAELSPDAPNRAQLVVSSFVLGMGLGTLITGPLSDAYGRRPVILGGALIYAGAAGAALLSSGIEALLITRFIAGLGTAAGRVCVNAIIRDSFVGREMAQVTSFVMMFFTLVPAIAPLVGTGLMAFGGWRAIFAAFVIFAALYATWFSLRQPETLAPHNRRPLSRRRLREAAMEVLSTRVTITSTLAQGTMFGMLFATLSSVQPIFAEVLGRGDTFVYWWAGITVLAASGSVVNARLVQRLGMRLIVGVAMTGAAVLALLVAVIWTLLPSAIFIPFLAFQLSVFGLAQLAIGNLNALALQPLGHIAGLGASVITSVSTVIGAAIAVPIGLAFDGSPLPLLLGTACAAALGATLMKSLPPDTETP